VNKPRGPTLSSLLKSLLAVHSSSGTAKPRYRRPRLRLFQVWLATSPISRWSFYPNAALFHYGSYEIRVITELKKIIDDKYGVVVDKSLNCCSNVLSVIHHHCYFPAYSNKLKDIASLVGYNFDNPINSGVRSIIF
jgi:predicted RecB family nuclease